METLITKGIQVIVEPSFSYKDQDLVQQKSLFSYEITIRNHSINNVQLIERFWTIFDALGGIHEVNGPGVVGKQPVLKPQESFTYQSWCPLQSEIGFMEGHFHMINLDDEQFFEVRIPRFALITPYLLN
jgi:ApaG protein